MAETQGSIGPETPVYTQLKGKTYPGYPKLPLIADARFHVNKEMKKGEKELQQWIGNKIKPMRISQISKKASDFNKRRKPNKSETLGFTAFFDGKAFEKITLGSMQQIYNKALEQIKKNVMKGIDKTTEDFYNTKSQTSGDTNLKSKWTNGQNRPSGYRNDIYKTLADSLSWTMESKNKGITKSNMTMPINQIASIQVGSFSKSQTGSRDKDTFLIKGRPKPTGVFGSRDPTKKKSLTQLYATKINKFDRKSSPIAGTVRGRLKGISN